MKTLINNINSKPYHVRRRWVFGLTTLAVLLVVSGWALTIRLTINPIDTEPEKTAPTASSFQAFRSSIKEAWGALKEGVSGTVEEFEKLASSTLGEPAALQPAVGTEQP